MNRIVLLVAALVVTAPALGVGTVGASEEVTLTVHVIDDGGDDVGGATVTVTWDGGEATDETRSNGRTMVDVPKGADVSIDVDHDEFVANNPAEFGTVDDHESATVEVYPETDAEITVEEDGEPVADATVTLTKDGDTRAAARGTTGADGVFAAEAVEIGSYEVTVERQGYYDASTTVDLEATDAATVAVESGTVSVSVAITDGHLERPLEADVTLLKDGQRDATLSTNEDGERTIPLDVNTEYTAVVEAEGYGENERSLSVGESDVSVTYAVERSPVLTLEASNERVLVGESVGVDVTDEYGEPVADAEITADGEVVATTAEDGSASVPVEAAGALELTATTDEATSNAVVVDGVDPDADQERDEEEPDRETEVESETEDSVPGFGGVAAVAALAAVVAIGALRR